MDPATISLIATGVVTTVKAIAELVTILNHPATTPEQRRAALEAANRIIAAAEPLNALWASLAPNAEGK